MFSPRAILPAIGRYALYAIAFFVIAAGVNWFQAPRPGGEKLEKLELTALDGSAAGVPLTGKKTIVYFFAPWCTVCKVSMDALNMFAGKNNLQAIAVGLDYENRGELASFQQRLDVPVYAGSAALQRRFSVDRYPTVYIFDGEGRVLHTMVGYTSRLGIWLRTKI
jgi:thiol-disulfide isomerase/thioredoxin